MKRSWTRAVTVGAGVMMLAAAGGHTLAQQSAGSPATPTRQTAAPHVAVPIAGAASALPASTSSSKTQFRGRLPAYFAKVVDQKQRQTIYAIQEEYHQRLESLKIQLALLLEERDAKVDAVLSDQQRQQVEQMKAGARAKRGGAEESAEN